MKIKLVLLVSIFAFGLALNANAGAVTDMDTDLVPDAFDNCTELANGPGEGSNQVDSDQDGYGNACDADYRFEDVDPGGVPDDFLVTTGDFPIFLGAFTGSAPNAATDHNGDGLTTTADFSTFLAQFQGTSELGPGLACAGTVVPCLP